MPASKTPMLDKITAARDKGSEAIGEFLEWLAHERGIVLSEHHPGSWTCEHCGAVPKEEVAFVSWLSEDAAMWRHKAMRCEKVQDRLRRDRTIPLDEYEGGVVEHVAPGLYPAANASIANLLAAYFEIDEDQAECERRALLDEIRSKR